jgi:hypothetical protein
MRNVWKKSFCVLLGIAIMQAAGVAYSESDGAVPPTPALSFEAIEINLGPVYAGDMVTANFKFINAGPDELAIEKIDSSCGCLIPEGATRAYAPGEPGEIVVSFDASEAGTTGRIKKDIIVYSNDKAKPRTVLSLRAFIYTVEGGVPYEPATLNLGAVPVETSKTVNIILHENSEGGIIIEKVEVPEGFLYSLESSGDGDGIRQVVGISNKPAASLGPVSGTVKIHTNNKIQPVLEVPVTLDVIGQISIEPSRVFFGVVTRGEKSKKTVRLSSSDKPFSVLDASSDLEFLQISQTSKDAEDNHLLSISLADNASPGRFKGSITIKTDNKYQPEISILVLGTISDPQE